MRPGSSANLMSLISAFGDVLRTSSFRRTSVALFNLIWRNVFSLAIPLVTKAGVSTTPPRKSLSFLNALNSTNVSSLVWQSTSLHHLLLISHRLPLLLLWQSQLLRHSSIWGGIVMMMTAKLRLYHLFLIPFLINGLKREELVAMLRRYYERSFALLQNLCPEYRDRVKPGFTSFRPAEIAGRSS